MKRWIVAALEATCDWTHLVTWRRPWIWLPIRNGWCPLANLSLALDERWETGHWRRFDTADDAIEWLQDPEPTP